MSSIAADILGPFDGQPVLTIGILDGNFAVMGTDKWSYILHGVLSGRKCIAEAPNSQGGGNPDSIKAYASPATSGMGCSKAVGTVSINEGV